MTDLQHGILQWLAWLFIFTFGFLVGSATRAHLHRKKMLRNFQRDVDRCVADARIPRAAVIDVHGG